MIDITQEPDFPTFAQSVLFALLYCLCFFLTRRLVLGGKR